MARIRYLKPEFFSDEDLAGLPFQTRLTFAGLWCYADKAGRLEDRPKFLKAMIFPYDNVDMDKELSVLSNGKHEGGVPFIQRYEVETKKFIQILTWEKHQKPHHTEVESNFPPPPPLKIKRMGMEKAESTSTPLDNGEITVKQPLSNGALTVKQPVLPPKSKRTTFLADEDYIKSLKTNPAFEGIDIDRELAKLDAWLLTPKGRGKQKTRQRIFNWLCNVDKPVKSFTKAKPPTHNPPDGIPSAVQNMVKDMAKDGWKI